MKRNTGRFRVRRWWATRTRSPRADEGDGMGRRVRWLLEDLEERQAELLRQRDRLAREQEGVCQCCGREISARRMELLDGAVLCAACALIARRSRDLLDPLARRN